MQSHLLCRDGRRGKLPTSCADGAGGLDSLVQEKLIVNRHTRADIHILNGMHDLSCGIPDHRIASHSLEEQILTVSADDSGTSFRGRPSV
jgi:hypothetical protein